MKTKKAILYKTLSINTTIPKWTRLIKAENLPDKNMYFAKNWKNMTDKEKSYNRNYGFLLNKKEI